MRAFVWANCVAIFGQCCVKCSSLVACYDEMVLAEVCGLCIVFFDGLGGTVECVKGVDLWVGFGEIVGIVGELGFGKLLTVMVFAGLLEFFAIVSAEVR